MPPEAPTAAELLRAAIDESGLSVRALARKLAGDNASREQVEAWRRSLNKYLDSTLPSRPRAILIARALGKPEDYLVVKRPAKQDVLREIRAGLVDLLRRVEVLEDRLSER